jgi:hypothetical protein
MFKKSPYPLWYRAKCRADHMFLDPIRHAALRYKNARQRNLTELANFYNSDKGTLCHSRHGYTKFYQHFFKPIRDQKLVLLEIGLRHNPYYGNQLPELSPSLQMWVDYFPKATILGFDIQDMTNMSAGRVQVFMGNQGNPSDLRKITDSETALDIVIDDGSHASFHQKTTFENLFPALEKGGLYFVEDLHFQPNDLETSLPNTPKFIDLLKDSAWLARFGIIKSDISFYRFDMLTKLPKLACIKKSIP